MSLFKANREKSVEGNAKVVANVGKPGVYQFSLTGLERSSKFVKKDEPEADTLNVNFAVVKALDVPRVANPAELKGKQHTDVIDFSLNHDTKSREEVLQTKLERVAHILSKVGVDKGLVYDTAEKAVAKLKDWKDYDAQAMIDALVALYTPEMAKKTFFGKVMGSVFNGGAVPAPICGFVGYNGFLNAETEPSFNAKERSLINDYYGLLEGQTPSSEGGNGGGGSQPQGAF